VGNILNPFGLFDEQPKKDKMPTLPAVPEDGPDSPKEREQLSPKLAPHETAAVLRMHRAGFTAGQICETISISKHQLRHEIQMAIDDEATAGLLGVPIYDARVPKTAK
jgi:hypothetical protein